MGYSKNVSYENGITGWLSQGDIQIMPITENHTYRNRTPVLSPKHIMV